MKPQPLNLKINPLWPLQFFLPFRTNPNGALGPLQGPLCTCQAVLWTQCSCRAYFSCTPRLGLPWEDGSGGTLVHHAKVPYHLRSRVFLPSQVSQAVGLPCDI